MVVEGTYNHVTVDGDTSVCDTVLLLASGLAGNEMLDMDDPRLATLAIAIKLVASQLCRMLAADGEGRDQTAHSESGTLRHRTGC